MSLTMAIWIQSLSWTLIYALGQGFVVYASLWLILKLVPAASAHVKHHLSLSALTVLFVWFIITWWQQFHALVLANPVPQVQNTIIIHPSQAIGAIENDGNYRTAWSSVNKFFPWLSAFYFLGLVVMLVRLSAGMLQLFLLRRTGISQAGTALNGLLISLKNKLHFEGRVQLFISAKAQVPMVIGFLKPIILVPAAAIAQLSTEQLETILLHELAHIKRYDYLVNILQTVVETVLFFNPFVWMISAIIRREREHCCDDLVLDHTREPLFYATALAALATSPKTMSAFTVAASGRSNHLFNRIKRIMEMKKNPFSYSRMIAAILIVSAITCSVAWLTPSFAQSEKNKPAAGVTASSASLPKEAAQVNNQNQEENILIQRLVHDNMIDEIKGFVVEKKQNKLYINGRQQEPEIAGKYLPMITKEVMRIEVYSFMERLKQHPKSNFLQVLIPVSFSSPCVDYKPVKEGC